MSGLRRRANLTGAALSSSLSRWTQPGFIKSIQRSTVTIASGNTSATQTITAVDPSNSRLKFLGCDSTGADAFVAGLTRLTFTNGTTITATVNTAPSANLVTSFEVIEYFPGVIKNVQRSTITVNSGATTGTASITPVTTTKAEVSYLGATVTSSDQRNLLWLTLTNATTVTATNVATAPGNGTVGFEVVEWF
jgi:hypothetical protein